MSELGPLASEIAGQVGPAPPERAAELEAPLASPTGPPVGLNGLERAFDERLAGTPGGTLRAGSRVLAAAPSPSGARSGPHDDRPQGPGGRGHRAGRPLRRDRGDAAQRTAEVLGLAGIAYSRRPSRRDPTFKIVTLAGLLDSGRGQAQRQVPRRDVDRRSRASTWRTPTARPAEARCAPPSRTPATRVFAPLGAKLGAKRLVQPSETFGFNENPCCRPPPAPTISAAPTR